MDVQEILNHCETALKHHEKTLNKFKANYDGSVETDKLIEYQIGRIISYRDIIDNIHSDDKSPLDLEPCEGITSKDAIEQVMYFINADDEITTKVKSEVVKKLKEILKIIAYLNSDGE